jgi:hypothetical protein
MNSRLTRIYLLLVMVLVGNAVLEVERSAAQEAPWTDVKAYGAKGDGTDDTAAIRDALNAVATSKGRLYFPPGTYKVSATLTIANREGFRIEGAGMTSTQLVPTTAVAGSAVLRLVNCRDGVISDLGVLGNSAAPPSAGVQFHRAASGGFVPTNMKLSNMLIGGTGGKSLVDGIRFTGDVDSNNAENTVENVKIVQFSRAGISIEHSNSLNNRIIGGVISYGPAAVRTTGGGFIMMGTAINVSDVDFDLGRGTYEHPLYVTNVSSESGAKIIRTATSPLWITFTGYHKKGSAGTTIDFRSVKGAFVMIGSHLNLGDPSVSAQFTDPGSLARFVGNMLGIPKMVWNGSLYLSGNRWESGRVTEVPGPGATLAQIGDTGAQHGQNVGVRTLPNSGRQPTR